MISQIINVPICNTPIVYAPAISGSVKYDLIQRETPEPYGVDTNCISEKFGAIIRQFV